MSRKRRERSNPNEAKPVVEAPLDSVDALLLKARKLRKKGEDRKAFVTLRHAVNLDEKRPRAWALLGAMAERMGLDDEAARAFDQARWLNVQGGFARRAAVCERLAASLVRDAA